jgi:hypothetical protein
MKASRLTEMNFDVHKDFWLVYKNITESTKYEYNTDFSFQLIIQYYRGNENKVAVTGGGSSRKLTNFGRKPDDRGSRVRFPAGAVNFPLHHRVRNGSGTHPASYPMGTRGSFFGFKAAGA